jgi:hypothetical protein
MRGGRMGEISARSDLLLHINNNSDLAEISHPSPPFIAAVDAGAERDALGPRSV